MSRLVLVLLGTLTGAARLAAQTSFPMVTHCTPVAVQRGTTATVTVTGQMNFAGAYKVLFGGTGVRAEVVPDKAAAAKSVALTVTAAADAPLGVREFRVASGLGISSLGQLLVVDDPVVHEAPGNKPQPIPVPCVVSGRVEALENVDTYTFRATAGTVLTFEVVAARIEDKIHDLQKHLDPLIVVTNAAGKELAASDDGYFADPVLTFAPPADGEYAVKIRDAKYDGDPRWAYALCVTDRPYVEHLYPLAANPGRQFVAEPVGSAGVVERRWPLVAPKEVGVHTVSLFGGDGRPTNPAPLVVTDKPLALEREPNDTPSTATRMPLPGGANGRIGTPRDLDHFVFAAKKGVPVSLTIFARRYGTPLRSKLDSVLDVMTPAGKVLASNDDAFGKDAAVTFTPPADGDYVVRVRDLNNKGGPGFAYYLEADLARPDFDLKVDPAKAMIGPGSRTAWFAQVARRNGFAGPVKVEVRNLPAGVTASPLTVPANMTQGLIVLSAAAGAKPDAAEVEVIGTAELDGKPATRTAVAVEEIYLPGGGRGRFDAGLPAIAVTGPSDLLAVNVPQTRVLLKPGQEVKLDVKLTRRPDFDKPVTLDVPLRHLGTVYGNPLPPGVTMLDGKSKTLLGGGSNGHVVLKASADAPECADVPVCVQAFVAVNFVVKIGYSSAPILLTVAK